MRGATSTTHYKHREFAENILNASRSSNLKEAAQEWDLGRLDASTRKAPLKCQVCNTRIIKYALIVNRKNKNHLVIGFCCYDKLLHFLATDNVESTLPPRKKHEQTLQRYWRDKKANVEKFDQTFLGWLECRFKKGLLPKDVARVVSAILRLKFAPTTEDADKVVDYYKKTRLFPLFVLVSRTRLRPFPCWKFLPREITINLAQKLKEAIRQKEARARATKARRIEEGAKEIEEMRKQAIRLAPKAETPSCSWILEMTGSYQDKILDVAVNSGTTSEVYSNIAKNLDQLEENIQRLTKSSKLKLPLLKMSVAGMLCQWWEENRWELVSSEPILLVAKDGIKYALAKKGGRWWRHENVEWSATDGLEEETGLYRGKVLFENSVCHIFLQREMPAAKELELILQVNFNEESAQKPGTFVGRVGGVVALPSREVKQPGVHTVFVMSEGRKYLRVWVI